MNARFLTTAAVVSILTGLLPAKAADPNLLNLVMPDAKVLAGVNVDQAKTTPFGQYVLSQIQSQGQPFQELTNLTGFDPTRDVAEVLVANSSGAAQKSGLLLARGIFDPTRILAAAQSKGGSTTETYNGVTILEDAKRTSGLAFLSSTYVVAGDLANVKAAIDRRSKATVLPSDVSLRVNEWSTTQDAWTITTVPPASLHPAPGAPVIPGVGPGQNNALQGIQQAAAGVKFGTNVVVKAQAQAATAQDATQLGDTVKLLASLAQMQSNGDPKVLALSQSLTVGTAGNLLNVSVSLPQDQLVGLLHAGPRRQTPHKQIQRKM